MALTRARARGGGGRFESTEQEWLQAPFDPDAAGKAAGAGGLHRVGFSNGGALLPLQAIKRDALAAARRIVP
jgi:hypothetical protein